jgi:septal ring factor EnvC (AmiA/AmiB activator)
MSDYGYSPSCSPTYRREQEALWIDNETYIPEILRPPVSSLSESSEENKEEELEKTKRELEKTKEELEKTKKDLIKLSKIILEKDIDVKELSKAWSDDVKILTKLWHLIHDISLPEKRVEIREVIQRWYISYWQTF